MKRFVVVGGGAAGFFGAINAAENCENLEVIILEGSQHVLQKVKVSGGGRCNVTHACFDPKELTTFYPRGAKELLGPFHQFMTGDTFSWFEDRGIPLKIEEDQRVFPASNSSQTIVDCFLTSAKNAGVELRTSTRVVSLDRQDDKYLIGTNKETIVADFVLVATGSNSKIWDLLNHVGHTIISPVPSLFTFNVVDRKIAEIPGVSVPNATIEVKNTSLESNGPILITHWGLSGPGIIKLSSWGALDLAKEDYQFQIDVNWISKNSDWVVKKLKTTKSELPKKMIGLRSVFLDIPKRLWANLVEDAGISTTAQWAQVSNEQIRTLAKSITHSEFKVMGKSTFKEEFVTAGGIDLKEVNFKHFESKIHKNLFFAGEILNIDALTGGFNFQNAWTGAWIVAQSIAKEQLKN